jgi:predicted TIM-barrel fold metal-dependent hydrolase
MAREHTTGDYIDAHVHVWTPDQNRYPRSGPDRAAQFDPASFTPEELLRTARPSGVRRVVLVQMNFYGFDNSFMLDAIARYPSVFRGVAVIDETAPDACQQMRRLVGVGVRGFRIVSGKAAWLDSAGMARVWKCAAETGQAMCTLVDPPGLPAIDRMCAKFSDTNVVVDHLARIGMDGPIRNADLAQLCGLARHKHVYVKVSAFYALGEKKYPYLDLTEMIHRVYQSFGPSRLMWGSDSPFQELNGNTYAGSIKLVRDRLGFLTADDRQWLLRKTAEQVFFQA